MDVDDDGMLDVLVEAEVSFIAVVVEGVALALGEDVVLVLGEDVVVVDEEGVDEFTLDVVDESFFLKWSPMASALPQARAAMETEMNMGASLRIGNLLDGWWSIWESDAEDLLAIAMPPLERANRDRMNARANLLRKHEKGCRHAIAPASGWCR